MNVDDFLSICTNQQQEDNKPRSTAKKLLIITSTDDTDEDYILSCLKIKTPGTVVVNLNNKSRSDTNSIYTRKIKRSSSSLVKLSL